MYRHISFVSFVSQYLYLCNHLCIHMPQNAKAPKQIAQSLYVYSNGPQWPLISYHLYQCIWRGWVMSNDFVTTFYTHVHKHVITSEFSFPFYSTYLNSTQFSLKLLSWIYSKAIIKSLIKLILNNNKYQHADKINFLENH